jgi:hypothetical protein
LQLVNPNRINAALMAKKGQWMVKEEIGGQIRRIINLK